MPYYEYQCPEGHVITEFFRSFSLASSYENSLPCPEHGCASPRVPSTPLPAHLYGNPNGYHNPSPTKRFNTKTVSQKDGNTFSIS